MTRKYEIRYSDGRPDEQHDTLLEAREAIEREWPEAITEHDGDLTDGGPRTLCWACEADSIDDDGARAVAAIYA